MNLGRVKFRTENPLYWEVWRGDGHWWSIRYKTESGTYFIMNARGTILDPHGPTGQRLLNIVHEHERERVAKCNSLDSAQKKEAI